MSDDLEKMAQDIETFSQAPKSAESDDVVEEQGEADLKAQEPTKEQVETAEATIDLEALAAFLNASAEDEDSVGPPILEEKAADDRSEESALREQIERLEAQIEALRSKGAEPADTAPKSLTECIDSTTGEIVLDKLEAYIAAQREAAKQELRNELQELRAEVQKQQERERQELIGSTVEAMEAAWRTAEKAFPHFRNSQEAQLKVAKKLNDWFNMQRPQELILAAYAVAFPDKYAEAVLQYAEKSKSAEQKPSPATPPAVRRGVSKPKFENDEERISAMAKDLEQLLKGG